MFIFELSTYIINSYRHFKELYAFPDNFTVSRLIRYLLGEEAVGQVILQRPISQG